MERPSFTREFKLEAVRSFSLVINSRRLIKKSAFRFQSQSRSRVSISLVVVRRCLINVSIVDTLLATDTLRIFGRRARNGQKGATQS